MISLLLKDSQYLKNIHTVSRGQPISAPLIAAIDKLSKEFNSGSIQILKLNHFIKRTNDIKKPIWYEIQSINNKGAIDQVNFYTSHYIGYYSTEINNHQIEILIDPRFGYESKIFNYLLSFACNIYLPIGDSKNNKGKNYWLIALFWKAMLDKAITQGQIPKKYIKESKNLKTFKGRLQINMHIQNNLVDQSRFYCRYNKLTMNNTINKTIRYTFKILQENGMSEILKTVHEHDVRLGNFGVDNSMVTPNEIDRVNYTKLNIDYEQVMQISKSIILNDLASQCRDAENKAPFAYFIDMAELWELYLLKVLRKYLPDEFQVYSPNDHGGEWLLKNNMRQIRPDIIISKEGKILMIIDAKYKSYNQFGSTSSDGISREDLYQMNTYLYHYGKDNHGLIGLIVSPVANDKENDIHFYTNQERTKIGILNLDITSHYESEEFKDSISKREKNFCDKVFSLLN